MGVALQLYTGGIMEVLSEEDASSARTGSLLVAGGLSVAGSMFAGSSIVSKGLQRWTVTMSSFYITQSAGVAVTQGSNTGFLITPLTGAGMTSLVFYGEIGDTWTTSASIVVGNSGSTTTVSDGIISAALAQHKWTITIAAQSISKTVGATVTQGSFTGTLEEALTGAGMTSIVFYGTLGQEWVAGTAITVGGDVTVIAGNVNKALALDASTASGEGALLTAGGLGVAKRFYTSGGVYVEANTAATSPAHGSVGAVGGAGFALSVYAGASIVAEGTTNSVSPTTGSLLTAGGLGVA
jgi:hypothetical protein